jgi:hypothetical protein
VQDLGLTDAEYAAYCRALAIPGTATVEVALLTSDEDELNRLSPTLLPGWQIDVDADADVTHILSCTLNDPTHSLQLDSDTPSDGALYADRIVQLTYSVLVAELDMRVEVDAFTGPIVDLERDGGQISLVCHGKEEYGLGGCWQPLTIKAGARKTSAIRTIMVERTGEKNLDIPDLPARLPNTLSLGRAAAPFPRAKKIGQSLNRQLFYNGAGVCRLRIRPRRPVFTFAANRAVGSNITSPVKVAHDFTRIRNAIWFKGGKPKGQKKPVEYLAVAPKNHPLSPLRLGRTNAAGRRVGRYLVHEVTNEHVRSKAEAKRRALALLDDLLMEVLDVGFTSVLVPHLDPLDVVRVATDDFSANVRLRKFSMTDEGMTIGYHAVSARPNRRRIRHLVHRGPRP